MSTTDVSDEVRPAPTKAPDDKTVIVVCDDNEDVLEVVSTIVRRAGYNVLTAAGHKELLPLIDSAHPNLLICDIRMPERDGFWIAEHLQMQGQRIPIIFMTAYDSNLYRTYAPFVGSVGFVTKPIDSQQLLNQIKKALNPSSSSALLSKIELND
ncbi:MAG TPA: response regulator [Planctomycetota bacterium]|nr:response regulator [Planctomycetota bacterium]